MANSNLVSTRSDEKYEFKWPSMASCPPQLEQAGCQVVQGQICRNRSAPAICLNSQRQLAEIFGQLVNYPVRCFGWKRYDRCAANTTLMRAGLLTHSKRVEKMLIEDKSIVGRLSWRCDEPIFLSFCLMASLAYGCQDWLSVAIPRPN